MGLVILGVVLILALAILGDIASKVIKSRNVFIPQEIKDLRLEVATMRTAMLEFQRGQEKLQEEVSFTTRMLEDKRN